MNLISQGNGCVSLDLEKNSLHNLWTSTSTSDGTWGGRGSVFVLVVFSSHPNYFLTLNRRCVQLWLLQGEDKVLLPFHSLFEYFSWKILFVAAENPTNISRAVIYLIFFLNCTHDFHVFRKWRNLIGQKLLVILSGWIDCSFLFITMLPEKYKASLSF